MGTRRLEEMIIDTRAQAYSEDYSLTEGWDDNVVANLFTLGLNRLYHRLTQIDNPANIEEYTADVTAGQQAYDIPRDIYMAIRIMDVRYQWGGQTFEFATLRQSDIQDRFNYPVNIPDTYCIRNGQILLSPTPNMTRSNALIVNFQKRMRSLDVRRGQLASKTDSPVTITLSFSSTSAKNENMEINADSKLDKIDYICLVDRNGEPLVTAIPVNNYNSSTKVITAESTYSFPTAELAVLDAAILAGDAIYVVSGIYASTHSELDSQCETFLIEYVIARLLRLQSNTSERDEAKERELEALDDLVNAYRRYRPSVYPVRWVRNFRRTSYPFGSRGMF